GPARQSPLSSGWKQREVLCCCWARFAVGGQPRERKAAGARKEQGDLRDLQDSPIFFPDLLILAVKAALHLTLHSDSASSSEGL
ncbi:unnamed protein product, partial [Urochloa humidicola]